MKMVISLIMFLFAFSGHALGEAYDYQVSKLWGAGIVAGPKGQAVRMDSRDNNNLKFFLEFYSNNTYLVGVVEPTNTFISTTTTYIDIQIDSNDVIHAKGIFYTDRGILWLTIFFNDKNSNFIQQAINGNILRVKINLQNPIYLKFSLNGFSLAYNYAMKLCKKLYNN